MILSLSKNNYNIKSWAEKYPDFVVDLRKLYIHSSWEEFTNSEAYKENIAEINRYLSFCLTKTNGTINIFPYPDLVFESLNVTHLNNIKVVIFGQDPYHNYEKNGSKKIVPQAMGLCFSSPHGINIPPSLANIYKNSLNYKHIAQYPEHGNISLWAYQGVLLLNTTLTVQYKCPNGHEKYWKDLTDSLIKFISDKTENVVFMLWGNPSLKKFDLIDQSKHKVIVSSHPSPFSYSNSLRIYKSFEDTNHFKEANDYLVKHGKSEIVWTVI